MLYSLHKKRVFSQLLAEVNWISSMAYDLFKDCKMNRELDQIFHKVNSRLESLKTGTTFSLPDLYGEEAWRNLYIGDRVMAGNFFLRRVRQGEYPHVKELADKDAKNRRQYLKY